jgi:mRNA interferase RelE/StbE
MNGRYQVVVPTSVARALAKLPRNRQRQIQSRIDALADEPRPPGCVKLVGQENLWRIRVGDWRVIYEIHDDRRILIVVIIAHRRESYRGL